QIATVNGLFSNAAIPRQLLPLQDCVDVAIFGQDDCRTSKIPDGYPAVSEDLLMWQLSRRLMVFGTSSLSLFAGNMMLNASEAPKRQESRAVEARIDHGQSSVKDWQDAVAAAGYRINEPRSTTVSSSSSGTSK